MPFIDYIYNNLAVIVLIFARINGIFVSAPFFGSRNIPARVRIGTTLLLSLLLFPGIVKALQITQPIPMEMMFFISLIAEFLVGIVIGFAANLFFSVAQMAGQVLDMQIGFGMVNVLDPQSGQQMPIIGNFLNILTILIFLTTDAHHFLLISLSDSFAIIKLGEPYFQANIVEYILTMFTNAFAIAIKFCLPITTTILLVDVALGMLSKTMPQMNIFVVGMPAKIILGIFMFNAILPTYIYILKGGFSGLYKDIQNILQLFTP